MAWAGSSRPAFVISISGSVSTHRPGSSSSFSTETSPRLSSKVFRRIAPAEFTGSPTSAKSTWYGRRFFSAERQRQSSSSQREPVRVQIMAAAGDKLAVMVNGIPGNMGIEVAQAVLRRGLDLVPFSLTGEQVTTEHVAVEGVNVQLIRPSQRDALISQVSSQYPSFISVDYTHPSAVNSNADFYAANGLPFVMGTTGGDRDALYATTRSSGVYAVIAPNMGKQIVAFQAMMDYMADAFPGVFSGYTMTVSESHQSTKADTSGTAKAVVTSFNKMGIDFAVDQIELVRTADAQTGRMKVPEQYLGGHAFHTYHLVSPDGTVQFEFQHNVCGRRVYAEGTVDAVQFLARKIARGEEDGSGGRIFSMIDVLQAGAMQ